MATFDWEHGLAVQTKDLSIAQLLITTKKKKKTCSQEPIFNIKLGLTLA